MKVFDIDTLRCPKCGSLTPPIMISSYEVKCPDCAYTGIK